MILYALCHLTHANPYLAAFSAGAVLSARSLEAKEAFEPLGEMLAELAKFAALLVFGALLTPQLFGDRSLGGYVTVVLAIVLISRPHCCCHWSAPGSPGRRSWSPPGSGRRASPPSCTAYCCSRPGFRRARRRSP
ncbi:hypothetical protein GCM10010244_80160 [Streptomyces coeruleorubidus]|nr:hypothetical protein GCM10010244_80160 [Streptomyces bellus]